jgi:hypothetical protein
MAIGSGQDEGALERHDQHARKRQAPGLVLPGQL